MKLKCVKNDIVRGRFLKPDEIVKLPITVGKTYEVFAVPISNSFQGTMIDLNDIKFLIYNDQGEWNVYPKKFFMPVHTG